MLLAERFLRDSRAVSARAGRLAPRRHARARAHAWPGNVRELENLMHREFLLNDGPELRDRRRGAAPHTRRQRAASRGSAHPHVRFAQRRHGPIAEFERAYIAELLARSDGNVSLAARLAGKERSRLSKLIRKHELSGADFARHRGLVPL